MKTSLKTGALFALLCMASVTPAMADVQVMKAYKEAFPGKKVRCIDCHATEHPTKEAAPLNDYGNAIKGAGEKPTADTIKKVGPVENFKKA